MALTPSGTFHSGISRQSALQVASQIVLKVPGRGACLQLFGISNDNAALRGVLEIKRRQVKQKHLHFF